MPMMREPVSWAMPIRHTRLTTMPLHLTSAESMSKTIDHANRESRRHRWWQFSLRAAFLCVLLLAIVFSWFAARFKEARDQQAAVVAINGMGGSVRYQDGRLFLQKPKHGRLNRWARTALGDDFFDSVEQVWFQGAHVKSWTMEEYKKFGNNATAEQLSRWEPWTYENVLALKPHLENLPQLELLSFGRTTMPRHGLEVVADLHGLRSLDLEQTQLTSDDLKYLSGLEDLEWLNLRRTRIRDGGLIHLTGLPRLKTLWLGSTEIGDEGLKHVAQLSSLEFLYLENTNITDDGIAHLRKLSKLKSLNVNLTEITDACIDDLSQIPRLKRLTIGAIGGELTSDGMAELSRELPDCEIRWVRSSNGRRRYRGSD